MRFMHGLGNQSNWEPGVLLQFKRAAWVDPDAVTCSDCQGFVVWAGGFPDPVEWLSRGAPPALEQFALAFDQNRRERIPVWIRGRPLEHPRRFHRPRRPATDAEIKAWYIDLGACLEHISWRDPEERRAHLWKGLITPLLPLSPPEGQVDQLCRLLGEEFSIRDYVANLKYEIYPVVRSVAVIGASDRRKKPFWRRQEKSKILSALCTYAERDHERTYLPKESIRSVIWRP